MLEHKNISWPTPLKVRVGHGYAIKFIIRMGQRNAEFIEKLTPPLRKIAPWTDAFVFTPGNGYDLIHSFNAVPLLTARPYIVTFEDVLPRVPEDRYIGWLERWLQRRICREQCIGLIAMSEYAKRKFLRQNRSFPGLPELKNKLHQIYPAKNLYRQRPKRMSDRLRLIFAGNDDMRKGLPALLRAHKKLKHMGLPVETTVCSALTWHSKDYIGPESKTYVEQERRLLNQDGVDLRHFVSYDEFLQLTERADYLLLPTLHDTFGFVSLDALSCATPAIVTDTCAQPEIIVDGECGYLLPFDNTPGLHHWAWLYRNRDPQYFEAYKQAIKGLSEATVERLLLCWDEKKDYERLSAGALKRVRRKFHIDSAREQVEQLYELCRAYQPNSFRTGFIQYHGNAKSNRLADSCRTSVFSD